MDTRIDINIYLRGGSNVITVTVLESNLEEAIRLLKERPKTQTIQGHNGLEILVEEVAAFQVVR